MQLPLKLVANNLRALKIYDFKFSLEKQSKKYCTLHTKSGYWETNLVTFCYIEHCAPQEAKTKAFQIITG